MRNCINVLQKNNLVIIKINENAEFLDMIIMVAHEPTPRNSQLEKNQVFTRPSLPTRRRLTKVCRASPFTVMPRSCIHSD